MISHAGLATKSSIQEPDILKWDHSECWNLFNNQAYNFPKRKAPLIIMEAFFFENYGNAVPRGSRGALHGAPNMTNIRIWTTGDHFMTRVTLLQSGITTKISMVCRRYPRYRIFHPLISCSLPQRKPCHNISWEGQNCQIRQRLANISEGKYLLPWSLFENTSADTMHTQRNGLVIYAKSNQKMNSELI